MEFVKKNLSKWISALVILVVGILCIVAAAASGEASASAYEGISIVLGIALLAVAILAIIIACIAVFTTKGEAKFGEAAIGSSIVLALGIFFIANKGLGGELIWLFLNFVPYVLIVVGSIIVVDAILNIIFAIVKKSGKAAIIPAVISIIVGAVAIVFGCLMIGNDPVISKDAQLIIFGIILIIYAALICLATFSILPSKKKDDAIDAKVEDAKEEPKAEEKAE